MDHAELETQPRAFTWTIYALIRGKESTRSRVSDADQEVDP